MRPELLAEIERLYQEEGGVPAVMVDELLSEIERLEAIVQKRVQTLSTLECVIDDFLEVAERAAAVKKAHTKAFLQDVKGELPWLKR